MRKINDQNQQGFTLVEMAIVLIIFGFLIAALLLPLQAQRDIAKQLETEAILENSKKALVGFAQAKGYLPCPIEVGVIITDNICPNNFGFLPANILGLQPVDKDGFALDAWNNRIRYAVTTSDSNAFTTKSGMTANGITELEPNLKVCASSNNDQCNNNTFLINNAVAVIFSLGATGEQNNYSNDEDKNINGDHQTFVSHISTATGSTEGEFDHIVTWLSPYILYNAMIQSGQLH
jgi:prepilin-type N-terminal cleavage/methylation domain-containing protein